MRLEDQVCSLELAKRLKVLGVSAPSLFAWSKEGEIENSSFHPQPEEKNGYDNRIAAFTVAELGEMLPDHFDKDHWQYDLSCWKEEDGWRIHYGRVGMLYHQIEEPTEADARAKMLIYLIEEKLIAL
jgi:hypothetical protein